MRKPGKLAGAASMLLLCWFVAAPANAQSVGIMDQEQMGQFAPMLEMMKKRMGKRRFGQLMRTMGPMMADMMQDRGGEGWHGGFGSGRGLRRLSDFGFGMGRGHRWGNRGHRSFD